MWKTYIALSVLLLAGPFAFAQYNSKPAQTAAASKHEMPSDAAKDNNPVQPTPESIEGGKKTYGYDCAMCHGTEGSGKGSLAVEMKLHLGGFRDPKTLRDKTDRELFYIIKNGKGHMPAEGERAQPDDIWDLVNYIRSLSKKEVSDGNNPSRN